MELWKNYEARLISNGYKLKLGVHFLDSNSHVTIITSVEMLIVITSINNLEIHQMDVNTNSIKP